MIRAVGIDNGGQAVPFFEHVSRREACAIGVAALWAARGQAEVGVAPNWKVVATGLLAPESPKPQDDGTVLLVEMVRGSLSRVQPDGRVEIVAALGNMPNGCAVGPDGAIYVTNNAAARFRQVGTRFVWAGKQDPKGQSSIQRVDPRTGRFKTLYRASDGVPLVAPNDLVFSSDGNFYFTDIGAFSTREKPGAVYFADISGSQIRRIADVPMANGIVLSPDGRRLLVASDKVVAEFTIEAPGELKRDHSGHQLVRLLGPIAAGTLDSMAAEADGGIVAGTLFPGGLSRIGPRGQIRPFVPIPIDDAVTNVGFGGLGLRTAYVSLTGMGRLISVPWDRPGLQLAFR